MSAKKPKPLKKDRTEDVAPAVRDVPDPLLDLIESGKPYIPAAQSAKAQQPKTPKEQPDLPDDDGIEKISLPEPCPTIPASVMDSYNRALECLADLAGDWEHLEYEHCDYSFLAKRLCSDDAGTRGSGRLFALKAVNRVLEMCYHLGVPPATLSYAATGEKVFSFCGVRQNSALMAVFLGSESLVSKGSRVFWRPAMGTGMRPDWWQTREFSDDDLRPLGKMPWPDFKELDLMRLALNSERKRVMQELFPAHLSEFLEAEKAHCLRRARIRKGLPAEASPGDTVEPAKAPNGSPWPGLVRRKDWAEHARRMAEAETTQKHTAALEKHTAALLALEGATVPAAQGGPGTAATAETPKAPVEGAAVSDGGGKITEPVGKLLTLCAEGCG